MDDIRFILNIPIEIDNIGLMYPMSMVEYANHSNLFTILTVTRDLFLQQFEMKDTENRDYIYNNINDFDVLCSNPENLFSFMILLSKLFKTDEISSNCEVIYKTLNQATNYKEIMNGSSKIIVYVNGKEINRNNYDYIRNMIIKVNGIRLPKQSHNPELQKWFDKSRNYKSSDIDMEDILTTVMKGYHYTPNQIKELTVYQVNSLLSRMNIDKEFETNVKYICAGAEKIKIESYMKHIDLFKEEKISTDFDEFKKKMGGIVGN